MCFLRKSVVSRVSSVGLSCKPEPHMMSAHMLSHTSMQSTCTHTARPGLLLPCHSPHLMSQLVQELLVCVGQEATALLLRGERKRWGLGQWKGGRGEGREGEGEREKGGREGGKE